MDSIRRASGFLFYAGGVVLIALILLFNRGMLTEGFSPYLHSLDLPILLIAMLYGGSSLYVSLSRGKKSLLLFIVIFVPLGVLLTLFGWLNFSMPFGEL